MSTDNSPIASEPSSPNSTGASGASSAPTITIKEKAQKQPLSAALVAAMVVATLGLGFGIGRFTAPQPQSRFPGNFGAVDFPMPNASGAMGDLPVVVGGPDMGAGTGSGPRMSPELAGTVTSVSGSTVTVQLDRGTTITVTLGSDTAISQKTTTTAGDIVAGSKVTVGIAGASVQKLFGAGDGSAVTDLGQAASVTVTK